MELTLPWPPSTNHYWKSFKGRVVISTEGRLYRKAIIDQVIIQSGVRRFEKDLRIEIEVFPPDKRRRDIDNLLKSLLDSLTHAQVWIDDSQISDLRIFRNKQIAGMVKVRVYEING
jgi:crossover junction endodeoxyribonuclease RusA